MIKQDKNPQARQISFSALLRCAVLLITAIMATTTNAAITFTFNYTDPAGVGFNAADPLGASRKTSLVQTGILLSNLFPSLTANIRIDVNGAETVDSTLAAAGSNYNSAIAQNCQAGFNGRGDVGIIALGGIDPSPATADGSVTVNFQDFMWDLDDVIDPTQFDFKSTMLHELLHASGFSHSIMDDGADACGQAAPTAGGWVPFDQHLGNITAKFINAGFIINNAAWVAAITGGTGNTGVLWRGASGLAANNGVPIPMFSPNPVQQGSSISHLDDNFYTTVALLMEAATGPGQGTRTLSPIERGIMTDIGYPAVATTNNKSINLSSPLLLLD